MLHKRVLVVQPLRSDITKPQIVESMERLLKRCLSRTWDAELCEDIRSVLNLYDNLEHPQPKSDRHNLGVDGRLPPDERIGCADDVLASLGQE